MERPNIKSTKPVIPMIYAYTTPEVARHDGWTKIGYTEQDVDKRIKQQSHTIDVEFHLEWKGNAIFDDGSGELFTDKDFHAYMRKAGVEQEAGKNNEWFHVTGLESRKMFNDFRMDHGVLQDNSTVLPYALRKEQKEAVSMTADYYRSHEKGEFLWNAKPRFGKTLTVYDFCKTVGAENVLIVTNRPAIANSWFDDYRKFIGCESGYLFVSQVDALKERKGVLSRKEYLEALRKGGVEGCIEFVSLQDMKGSIYFNAHGDGTDKLKEVKDMKWDVLVIDEAHEGVDTYKTDVAFEQIKRDFTLHLSGTPFKALAGGKFDDDAIYNWTYADEQERKENWDNSQEEENPYATLPRLSLFTYQMSEIVKDELSRGIEIDGETEEYAFDLNEFFEVGNNGKFVHDSSVDKFLDALTRQEKYPFSTEELRNELKHTFWFLNRVDSAKALAKKLNDHPVFHDYKVVLAAGDGRIDDDDENIKSFDKVIDAIAHNEKTITLSVGQLTTGITIPEWTAVLMLSNVKSPALYMQAAFRAQNPCMFREGTELRRKENAYVFDFDPARTLIIFEEFANDLMQQTAGGRGDSETRKDNVRKLLNFFPVIGEDEDGELIELDAAKVLSIPRKIKSKEVVKRGFMSNFLFANISNVWGAPAEVMEIIEQFEPVEEPKSKGNVSLAPEVKEELYLNEDGDVEIPEEIVIGKTNDIFGHKIYDYADIINNHVEETLSIAEDRKPESVMKSVWTQVSEDMSKSIIDTVSSSMEDVKARDKKQIQTTIRNETEKAVARSFGNYNIKQNELEKERHEALINRDKTGETTAEINSRFEEKKKEAQKQFKEDLNNTINDLVVEQTQNAVKTVETNAKERKKHVIEDGVRDHLRGFSRTIPSFLMAYGDETVTLATFDSRVPDNVFKEVTSITMDQFRRLRDGWKVVDENGEEREQKGLFDQVVFDDSVKEFLALKKKLADYFDEKAIEDIFDYIPPQKTNQIFTPKTIVKRMVDMLEEENPGCFDDKDKTFIDLYMKSGLYITEIVKRLYQSPKMKEQFPDDRERLRHIFEKQVYGLAPTEIIYRIAISYILGFNGDISLEKHNFRQCDALPYAKEGTLSEKLDELFGK